MTRRRVPKKRQRQSPYDFPSLPGPTSPPPKPRTSEPKRTCSPAKVVELHPEKPKAKYESELQKTLLQCWELAFTKQCQDRAQTINTNLKKAQAESPANAKELQQQADLEIAELSDPAKAIERVKSIHWDLDLEWHQ